MIRFSGLAVGIVVLAGAVGAAQAPAAADSRHRRRR